MALSVQIFRLAYEDGAIVERRVLPVTIVAFERQQKKSIGTAMQNASAEDLLQLAWMVEHHHAQGSGSSLPPFDPWLETLVAFEMDGLPIPLDAEASPQRSAVSQ